MTINNDDQRNQSNKLQFQVPLSQDLLCPELEEDEELFERLQDKSHEIRQCAFFGCMKGTIEILDDIVVPAVPNTEWEVME